MSLWKAIIVDLQAIGVRIEGTFKSTEAVVAAEEAKVSAALSPVLHGFIQQVEDFAKQIGSTEFSALLTVAEATAKKVQVDPTLTSGPAKFAAFVAGIEVWAKVEAPKVLTLIETTGGPALRALLEMAIASATVALTGGTGAAIVGAAGAVAAAAVTKS